MEDTQIIDLFFARSEQAICELDNKYGKVCHSLSYNILHDPLDVEECVNDAYLGTWNAIPPKRPNPLLAFVCKIVRNLSIARYRANTAMKRNSTFTLALEEIEECLSSPVTVEDEIAHKELVAAIEGFLDSLSAENRVIFLRRYWFADSHREIAQKVGLTEKNVSMRLSRLRRQLKTHMEKQGVLT